MTNSAAMDTLTQHLNALSEPLKAEYQALIQREADLKERAKKSAQARTRIARVLRELDPDWHEPSKPGPKSKAAKAAREYGPAEDTMTQFGAWFEAHKPAGEFKVRDLLEAPFNESTIRRILERWHETGRIVLTRKVSGPRGGSYYRAV
jgi:hypothetical protein